MSDAAKQTVTIDGKAYQLADLSDNAKAHLTNVRLTDRRITQLQQELAMIQTARVAYARALQAALQASE